MTFKSVVFDWDPKNNNRTSVSKNIRRDSDVFLRKKNQFFDNKKKYAEIIETVKIVIKNIISRVL